MDLESDNNLEKNIMDIEPTEKLELEIKNAHERDKNIVFDEEPHIYYINGSNDNISITTFIHKMIFILFIIMFHSKILIKIQIFNIFVNLIRVIYLLIS